jgi:hypothetical protein
VDAFAVRLPNHLHPQLVSIHGAGNVRVGMGVFRGPRAAHAFDVVLRDGEASYEYMVHSADMVSLNFCPLREVPAAFRSFYTETGTRPRLSSAVPFLWVKEPDRQVRPLTRQEQADCALLLAGVVHAVERRLLTPEGVRAVSPGRLLTLCLAGDAAAPEVRLDEQPIVDETDERSPLLFVDPASLVGLPRLRERWVVGCPPIPVRIGDSDELPRLALVVDRASERLLDTYLVTGPRAPHQAADRLIELFRGRAGRGLPGLPERVLCTSDDLVEVLSPVLAACGVALEPAPELAGLPRQLAHDFLSFLDAGGALDAGPGDDEAAASGRDALPAPDDFAGWRAALDRLIQRCTQEVHVELRERPSLLGSFFGDTAAALELLGQVATLHERNACAALIEWCWLDRRKATGRRGPRETLAERQLRRGGLSAAERTLLEAMVVEPVSLYRVATIEPGQWLELEDLLRGGKLRLDDRSLSSCAVPGMALSARLFSVGRFHFDCCVGPPIDGRLIPHALAYLNEQGLKTSPAALARSAHHFGRLWLWSGVRSGHVRLLRQADGSPGSEQLNPDASDLDPALLAQLREHYRCWVDTPLLALGERTPRQAVQTADGRRQVEQLLRSLVPTVVGGCAVPSPLAELQELLGLEAESERPSAEPPPGRRRGRRLH